MTSIAFHSYKRGTGKNTIASNLAAMLATKGYRMSPIDLDVYAPSLQTYFQVEPKKWINDLLLAKATVDEVMIDMTSRVERLTKGKSGKIGKLWVGLSNPRKEEVYKMEGAIGKQKKTNMELLRKFI